eukprot:6931992-Ditylum_brightwellii.AAC.1
MPLKTKRCGVGAACSIIKRFLHSKKLVDEKYPNATHNELLDGLIALRREICSVNYQQRQVVVFCHEDFPMQEIYAVDCYSKVLEEGDEVHFFPLDGENDILRVPKDDVLYVVSEATTAIESPPITNNILEDIARTCKEGLGVDDDNEPAPENIPTSSNADMGSQPTSI